MGKSHVATIALMDESTGRWKPLRGFKSYDDADRNYDKWADKYPMGYVEIVDAQGNVY